MGYTTSYQGEIKVFSEDCKKFIQNYLLREDDQDDFYRALFDSEFDEKKGILTMNEDRKNYEEEMEDIFSLIAHYDKKAEGEILAEGEDGEEKEKFTISNGKVLREEGFIGYKNKKDITSSYEDDDLEEIDELISKSKVKLSCDKCKGKIDLQKFNFKNRGYYDTIHDLGYENLCEKCYKEIKKVLTEKLNAQQQLADKEKKLQQFSKNKTTEEETEDDD
jgi:hypothetical protein